MKRVESTLVDQQNSHSERSENLNIIKIYCGFYPQYVKNNYLVYFKAIFQKLKRFCVCNIKHTAEQISPDNVCRVMNTYPYSAEANKKRPDDCERQNRFFQQNRV